MSDDHPREVLSREDGHPRAREVLNDDFFWDTSDESAPFGGEIGQDILQAFYEFRDEKPHASPILLLDELLACWEVEDDHWDIVDEDAVQAVGAEDEFGLLTRDEAIIALAFAQIILEGRLDPEVRRRAILALKRRALPALLHGTGGRVKERLSRIGRMEEILKKRWD